MELRTYQQQAIQKLRHSLGTGKRRPVVQLPTGAGKTVIAASIINMARSKGKRVIVAVPSLTLIDQTVERFRQNGITEIGVMQAQHEMTDPRQPVQVCSIQTLMRRELPSADLVIVDEAHMMFKFLGEWVNYQQWDGIPFVGLTATPWARGMGKIWDDLIIGTTMQELIDQKHLCDFKVYAPAHPDLGKVKTVAGDYDLKGLGEAMDQGALVADIVTTWLEKGLNKQTVCFAVNRTHAKHIQKQFEEAGVLVEYMDAYTPMPERTEIIKRFERKDTQVICNVGVLTTGFDADVRCIILARPTKSEMLYVQMIGRGLRPATGKDYCIARGSKILTDQGLVNIENVTLDHKVWDGVSWVSHSGAVCRGVQSVIEYAGLIATADHRVMTNEGWKNFEEAAGRRLGIAVTGFGERSIRFAPDYFTCYIRFCGSSACRGHVSEMRADTYGTFSQHQEKVENSGMPSLQWEETYNHAKMVVSKVSSATRQMPKCAFDFLSKIRRSWNKIQFQFSERSGFVDNGKFGRSRSFNAVGSHQQQRSLRAEKSSLDRFCCEHEQHSQKLWGERSVHSVQEKVSACHVCGSDLEAFNCDGINGRTDNQKMGNAIMQTEREVWDILNAGPLQRFTANGLLVHNCLILDHSDTTIRLGFVTDINHTTLDDGKARQKAKAQPKERLPKECPKCAFLRPAKTNKCPACGFVAEAVSQTEVIDGELMELTKDKKYKKGEWPQHKKQVFYSDLRLHAYARGYKDGWAAHAYRTRLGVWPRGLSDEKSRFISAETESWIRHYNISKAKQREKQNAKTNTIAGSGTGSLAGVVT